jgi:integral membrane protein (TIGR01906 family)
MTVSTPASSLYKALSWLVSITIPVALVLSSIRLLLAPWFLPFEYNMPGFPADPYGFSLQDRLYWSRYALDYLTNDAGIEYLGDLRFADGSAVYNERELRHMLDVKIAITNTLRVWLASLTILVLLALWAWRGGWVEQYRLGLARGGLLTALLLVGILAFVALSFRVLFVAFHDIFFEAGTWMFLWSDTLIRLFPERFWRDIFIYLGVLSGGIGLLIWFILKPKVRK